MSAYLYGIVRAPAVKPAARANDGRDAPRAKPAAPAKLKLPDTGVGNPPAPVRLLKHRDLAAVVSDVPDDYHPEADGFRGMRRDMRAHAGVVNHIIDTATIVPSRFGIVFPDEASLVARVLRPQRERLGEYLDALEGSVEITLRATSLEEQALREVIAAHPELGPRGGGGRRGGSSMAHEAQIELGRRLAAAIQDLQEQDARWIIDSLAPAVRDVRVGKPLRDLMALNASFLVDRAKLKKFDRRLEEINAAVGHRMEFDCVGPLAPYSFVDLHL